jgi:hypothetical protein
MADLISGVNPSAIPASPVFGKTHPSSPFGGGFMTVFGMHVTDSKAGLWLVLSNTLTGTTAYLPSAQNVLTPARAAQIDRKMDDGRPDAGYVQSPDNGTCDSGSPRIYRESDEYANQKTCMIVFNIF